MGQVGLRGTYVLQVMEMRTSEFWHLGCLPVQLSEVSSDEFWTNLTPLTEECLECLLECQRSHAHAYR